MHTLKVTLIPPEICPTSTSTEISIINSVTWYEYHKYERLLIFSTFDHPQKIHLFNTIKVKDTTK